MRVLVIGGTNFIGPYVVAWLHQEGHEVTVYHRGLHEPDLPTSIRHIHSPHAAIPVLHFPSSLSDPPPDVVLNMFPVGEADARAAVARFVGVARRLIAISSGDVYRAYGRLLGTEPGIAESIPLEEDAPLRESLYPYRAQAAGPADWMYSYEKILVERIVLTSRLPGTVLRLPAVYGPGDPYRRLRPYIKRIDDGRPAILLDAAQARWRWTHGYVENVARAIALAVSDERAIGKVYNLGEAETPTVADRVRQVAEIMGWNGEVVSLSQDRLPSHLRTPYQANQDLVLDTRRIRTELDFDEPVSTAEGLRRTIAWERASPSPSPHDPGPEAYLAEDVALGLPRGDVGLEEAHT
jgi:nucleoside-diphosphate-sugar epimerase